MTAIPREYRETITPDEFRETIQRYGLQPARAGARLFVMVPGASRDRRGVEHLTASEWLLLLDSHRDDRGRVLLKIVRGRGDPPRLGVAWTEAGKHYARENRALSRLTGTKSREHAEAQHRAWKRRGGKRARR